MECDDDYCGTTMGSLPPSSNAAATDTPTDFSAMDCDRTEAKSPVSETHSIVGAAAAAVTDTNSPLLALDDGRSTYGNDYDATGASYEALFADGGLFSEFVSSPEGHDLWGDRQIAPASAITAPADGEAGSAHDVAYDDSIDNAVRALLATCPRLASCKPATLALERAPMVYTIQRHIRAYGGVDLGPEAGGRYATLDDACKSVEGLGPRAMLNVGVAAWLTCRLMERLRPGSSRAVPVAPLGRISAFVHKDFGGHEWTFHDPATIDQRFEEPERANLRALIAWIIDSACTVAVLRANGGSVPDDCTTARQPNGKDYTNGPLKRLAGERDAYLRRDPKDFAAWAKFLKENKNARSKSLRSEPREAAQQPKPRRQKRRLARTLPLSPTQPKPLDETAAKGLCATSGALPLPRLEPVASAPPSRPRPIPAPPLPLATPTAMAHDAVTMSATKPPCFTATPSLNPMVPLQPPGGVETRAAAQNLIPAAPHVPQPTTLDATAIDRQVIARVQSLALMSLAAAEPSGLGSDMPVTFMAPSIMCPGTMVLSCWLTLPPLPGDLPAQQSQTRRRGERPHKRTKRTKHSTRSRDRPAAVARRNKGSSAEPCDHPSLTTTVATATEAPGDRTGQDGLVAGGDAAHTERPAGAPGMDAPSLPGAVHKGLQTAPSGQPPLQSMAVVDTTDYSGVVVDAKPAYPRAVTPTLQPPTVPVASGCASADCAYDLDQLLTEADQDDWEALLRCDPGAS
jgi:hypothetical protein